MVKRSPGRALVHAERRRAERARQQASAHQLQPGPFEVRDPQLVIETLRQPLHEMRIPDLERTGFEAGGRPSAASLRPGGVVPHVRRPVRRALRSLLCAHGLTDPPCATGRATPSAAWYWVENRPRLRGRGTARSRAVSRAWPRRPMTKSTRPRRRKTVTAALRTRRVSRLTCSEEFVGPGPSALHHQLGEVRHHRHRSAM